MNKEYSHKIEFFASSNSCSGFKSYFESIFNSYDFDRIFVLKGGPGTGKSTLIKKVVNTIDESKNNIELFRCSSDKNSLDGLIIERGGVRAAIIDGTAPHERDAVIPGAVDVLVNLGDAINNDALYKTKKEVLRLNSLKKSEYKKAYLNLQKSSIFSTNIKAEILSCIDLNALSNHCARLFDMIEFSKNKTGGIRLISSFSKDGYSTLSSLKDSVSKCFTVIGEYGSEYIFITHLSHVLIEKGIPHIKLVSPLDTQTVEGIYLKDIDTAILCGDDGNGAICDMRDFISFRSGDSSSEILASLDFCRSHYQKEAANNLQEASKYHFELEDIYTSAVDFKVIDAKTEYVKKSISKIFS